MTQKISILGIGWLGLPLAKHLIQKGFEVKGSVRRSEKIETLREEKIIPYLLELKPALEGDNLESFFQSDILIINIPPRTRVQGESFHSEQIRSLLKFLKEKQLSLKIIYTSSTSVYPLKNDWVFEEDTEGLLENKEKFTGVNYTLLEAESLLKNNFENVTILRLGGLMGKGRMIGKYFAGKQINTGAIPVNWVHQTDVIQSITTVIEKDFWNDTLNVAATEHPTKKMVYSKISEEFNLEKPTFVSPNKQLSYKIVSNQKLLDKLGIELYYTNPLNFRYQ